jgi:hypothetical protein
MLPKPGVDYQDQYAEDYYLGERTQLANAIRKALGGH